MKLADAMMNIQYDPSWQIWARGTDPEAEAKYVQSTDRTGVLAEQGYQLIGNGESIRDYIAEFCGNPEKFRPSFEIRAVRVYLAKLNDPTA